MTAPLDTTGLALLDAMGTLIDLSTGYRAMCERAGYSPAISEQLAANYLNLMVAKSVQGAAK